VNAAAVVVVEATTRKTDRTKEKRAMLEVLYCLLLKCRYSSSRRLTVKDDTAEL
jgi:hypothetical protein